MHCGQTKKSGQDLHCLSIVNHNIFGMHSTIRLHRHFKHSRINQQAPETPIRPLSKSHARRNTVNLNLVIFTILDRALTIIYLVDSIRYSTLLGTFETMDFQTKQLEGTVDFDQSAQQEQTGQSEQCPSTN